ncbi:extracellular solute-binding protein [Caballeronia sp. ATUFL_M1_KS5A]|uniref:ABC transporter substrate-binding protein n=1 Tax=Caballeronia sp. ATUFL_M1_KS5A TaxID=2921778 RepID=UPI0020291F34|nr:extracellular solute-binding protein [Caballeronia sp. ATUFL_M1_KS5A]
MKNPVDPKLRPLGPVGATPVVGRRDFLHAAGLVAIGGLCAAPLFGCGTKDGSADSATAGPTPPALLSAAEQSLADAARKEGKLVLYTGSEESIVANLSKAFQRRYGVSMEYQRLNSNEIQARYTAEAQAGRTVADVVFTGDSELFQVFNRKGWLAKLEPSGVPGLSAWPGDFKDGNTIIVSVIPYAMAVNVDRMKVPQDARDWSLLVSPEARSGIVTVDANLVNLLAIAAWDLLLRNNGDDFMKRIGRQQLNLVDSGPSAVQQLASGAAKLYYPCSLTQAQSMIDQGAPIQTIVPSGVPYTGVMSTAAVSKGATHPNAARLFLAFMMTEEGQKILNIVGSSPVNTPGTSPLRKGFTRPDFASTAANRAKIIQLLRT